MKGQPKGILCIQQYHIALAINTLPIELRSLSKINNFETVVRKKYIYMNNTYVALLRMVKWGYLTRVRRGRKYLYALTESGINILNKTKKKRGLT